MVTINGKLVAAFAAVVFLSACGGKTNQPGELPPPLPNNFEGIYKAVNRMEADSILFFRIFRLEKAYRVIRYTWIAKEDSLYDRGWDGLDFVEESAHRLKADGGFSSISYSETENQLWYVHKPTDYRLKKVCKPLFTNSHADVKKALIENKAIPLKP